MPPNLEADLPGCSLPHRSVALAFFFISENQPKIKPGSNAFDQGPEVVGGMKVYQYHEDF